jgi:hypothetical protein
VGHWGVPPIDHGPYGIGPAAGPSPHRGQAALIGSAMIGWPWDKGDPLNPSSFDPGKALSDLGHEAQHILDGAHVLLSNAQGIISLVPGIGTGISAAIGAGRALLDGGSPLEIAVHAAYGAIPIPPGVKQFTDMVVDAALSLYHQLQSGANLASGGIATAAKVARDAILSKIPAMAKDLAGQVYDTLVHLILGAVSGHPTHAATTKPMTPAQVKAVQTYHGPSLQDAMTAALRRAQAAQAGLPAPPQRAVALTLPPHLIAIAPTTVSHAAVALASELKAQGASSSTLAPHASPAVQAPTAHAVALPVMQARPGSPGAPPGATHWVCHPIPGGPPGAYACQWQ